eukprot:CAMPEP_0181464370 /NCGR_PEP_ID=MMETSP1110-20121109/35399_1 /TAXON_ID=174948 /ORGANISM="Symbiodinium sp., Strain CCMP421" /LENGTH=114 /DNA_ID=CAMNT_0023589105 /DNA_START=510 /DNA_END=851 /DNA_ORIENTATION=+
MAEASEDLPEDVRQIGSTASQLHRCGVKALHFTVEKSKHGTRRLPSSVSSQTSGSSVPVFASGWPASSRSTRCLGSSTSSSAASSVCLARTVTSQGSTKLKHLGPWTRRPCISG